MELVDYKRNFEGSTDRGPSKALWGDCPWGALQADPNIGFTFFDDFLNFSQHITDQNVQGYSSYIDTGVTIKQLAAYGGVAEIAGNDADNDQGYLVMGGDSGAPFVINDSYQSSLWFEARIKKASIADNACALLVGLIEPGVAAAATLVNDTGAIADKDFIGFHVDQADGEICDFTYRKSGQTAQVLLAQAATLVADTWVKVGFKYDWRAPTDRRISIFVDGVEKTTYGTAANVAAATFPDGELLTFIWGAKVGTAAESKAQIDWVRIAQLSP